MIRDFGCAYVLACVLFLLQAQSVALTLESGSFVKFQYDLGTGPIEITNWAVRVQPGHWYTAYATRSVFLICFFLKEYLKVDRNFRM